MPRNEHLTRIELINPALFARGWADAHIREEKTPGGVDVIDGKPRKRRGRTDCLLCLPIIPGRPPLAVAVLEAKAEDRIASLGIQQACDYGRRFHTPFGFSTNGQQRSRSGLRNTSHDGCVKNTDPIGWSPILNAVLARQGAELDTSGPLTKMLPQSPTNCPLRWRQSFSTIFERCFAKRLRLREQR